MTGTIKKIFKDKGFGFIAHSKGEIFFHTSDCKYPFDSLNEGNNVSFESKDSPKGPRAIRVEKV